MPTFSAYDGTELAYHLVGEGEPLVCLPGGPMRASEYLGDLGGLAAYRRLVLLDLRGTGGSAIPADHTTYRCDRQADDVEALRAHLGLERLDLLGHSASGSLAALYAARYPDRVRSLTLVTPVVPAAGIEPTDEDRREAMALRSGEPWYETGLAAFEEIEAGRESPGAWEAVTPFNYGRWDDAARAFSAASDGQINPEAAALYSAPGAFDPAATRAVLRTLDVPVLVLTGELDGGPRPARARELVEVFPDAREAVVRGAAHFPWLDEPGAFVRTVAAFLDPGVHRVDVAGVRLAYRTWGERDAPPVVLLHGRCGNSRDWTEIAEDLARDRWVIAPDLSGHGLSDWPGRYGLARYRDELRGFLAALGLTGVDVVAHSMGGFAAYLLAQEAPELFGRLVLEESPPLLPLDPPRPPAVREEGELAYDWPLVPAVDAELNTPDPAWTEGFGRITAPTLVIAGGPDSHVAQEKFAWLAERVPGARLVTIDAGHLVHRTRPAEFLAALREFGI
ncbi:alpha/beta hydrolase [Streptomyces sp. NBC_01317]|uniref:alpha/beta fold hydrolase n=1 Tax=Streptomyces sp. NBC_01317 TaxID=2903822 RepID=UPI002E0EEA06|nr:alpha/beta hydrolase [Streptomyces sp. NBC_01317]